MSVYYFFCRGLSFMLLGYLGGLIVTKKQLVAHKIAVYKAQQVHQTAIEQFKEAMERADIGFVATMMRPTIAMKIAWGFYCEACTRLMELEKAGAK